jgi:3-oxoacyl-[acyl-carrier protein] reductase
VSQPVVLVAGGAGHAGSCVVRSLAARGTRVVVPSRSPERLARLAGPLVRPIVADMSDATSAAGVRDAVLAEYGRLDGVLASLGTYERGARIAELDPGTWSRLLHDNLTPHFVTARTFAPVLAEHGGVYATLAGVAATEPMIKAAPISVTGAGQTMLLRVLAAEYAGAPVRFHEVAVLTPIAGHWFDYPPQPGWLTGEEVGDYVATLFDADFPEADRLLLAIPEPDSPRVWWRRDPDTYPDSGDAHS